MPPDDRSILFRPPRAWLFLARAGFLGAAAMTLFGAFAPQRAAPHLLPWDKAQHFLAFYVLSGLAAAAYPRIRISLVVASMLVLGAAIEVVQGTAWVHRDADIKDWAADAVGVAFALVPLLLARWRREARSDPAR